MDLLLNNITIDQIDDKFSLTDVWKAAGSPPNKKPYRWLRIESACEMVNYFNMAGESPLKTVKGKYGGTYGTKPLVYDYAAYLDVEFKLMVYKVFDDYIAGKLSYIEKENKQFKEVIMKNNIVPWIDANTASHDNNIKLSLFLSRAVSLGFIKKYKRYVSLSNQIIMKKGTLYYSPSIIDTILKDRNNPHSLSLFFT